MVFVTEFQTSLLGSSFSPEFLDLLPTSCPSCDSPMDVSLSLSSLSCSNPTCPQKVVQRTLFLLKWFGVEGFTPDLLERWVVEEDIVSAWQLFNLPTGYLFPSIPPQESDTLLDSLESLPPKPLSALPLFSFDSKELLEPFSSLRKFYERLDQEGYALFGDYLDYTNEGIQKIPSFVLSQYTEVLSLREELEAYFPDKLVSLN